MEIGDIHIGDRLIWPVVRLECRSNNYYEVVVDGEPTGQGSFDYNEAEDIKRTIEERGLDV